MFARGTKEDVVFIMFRYERVLSAGLILLIISFLADMKVAVKNIVRLVRSLALSCVTFCIDETVTKRPYLRFTRNMFPHAWRLVSSVMCSLNHA